MGVFDENGLLRDQGKRCEFEQLATEDHEPRKHWKTLRMDAINARKRGRGYVHSVDSNWPIKPTYYNKDNMKHEQKIQRIKKQYLNGMNNANNSLYKIIGDLMHGKLMNVHPMTIKHGYKVKKK